MIREVLTVWRLVDECNRYRWRAALAFVVIIVLAPFFIVVRLIWEKRP